MHRLTKIVATLGPACSSDARIDELIAAGRKSREASGADYVVANTLDMVEGQGAGAFLIGKDGLEWVPREKLPARMVELVRQRYAGQAGNL